MQNCTFCQQPNLVICMNRSLQHKYNQDYDKNEMIIDELLKNDKSQSSNKYKEIMLASDCGEYLEERYQSQILNKKYCQLLQYYKYRIFVPLFSKSPAAQTVLSYYYDKLKNHYNNIKRQLNLTVDPSSPTDTYTIDNTSQNSKRINSKQQMLKDVLISTQYNKNDKNKSLRAGIAAYKSQSKALQQLVSYLKFNSNFQHIKSLRTQDCFGQNHIYQKKQQKKTAIHINPLKDSFKATIKAKILKKITQSSNPKNFPTYLQRQQPFTRQKSTKIIHHDAKTAKKMSKQTKYRIKQVQIKLNQSRSITNISKKNLITKINPIHNSPYKKKSFSSEKQKQTKIIETNQNLRSKSTIAIKNMDQHELSKIKESLLKFQAVKIENQNHHKVVPVSPSTQRRQRKSIQFTKNDNILSIRKKKIEALKQRNFKR